MSYPQLQVRRAPRPLRGVRIAAVLSAVLTVTACEVPTGFPEWETTWVVPADSNRIEVESLLPSTVQVVAGPAFQLTLPAINTSQSLGTLCGPTCTAAQGQTVPKPQFTGTVTEGISLPQDVLAASIVGGRVVARLQHDFSFDPLRPAAGSFGYVVITATSGTQLLARDSIAGEARDFPANTPITINLPLSAATVEGPIDVRVRLFSPAGDPVTINTAQRLTVNATPEAVRLSEARVRVANEGISGETTELDLGEVDQTLTNRVRRGALILELANPFTATGRLDLRITTPTRTIDKSVQLAAGTTTTRVEFNEDEIQSILGASPVTLSVTGSVSGAGAGGAVTVRPGQAVVVKTRLELVIVPVESE